VRLDGERSAHQTGDCRAGEDCFGFHVCCFGFRFSSAAGKSSNDRGRYG
jgi:hypothetical protein